VGEVSTIVVDTPAIEGAGPLALALPDGLPIEQWEQVGRTLFAEMRQAEDRTTQVNWWIGDWWAYGSGTGADGKPRYGARAKAVAEGIFGTMTFQAVADCGYVARKIEASRRREVLPFTHHREVAALEPEAATRLLTKAAEQHLSTRDLRKEVLRHRIAIGHFTPNEDDDPEHAQLLAIARAWNRARPSVREEFLDMAQEAGLGEIDP
jgi:hypothetical protein